MNFRTSAERLGNRQSGARKQSRSHLPLVENRRLQVESLESRLLLYAVTGGVWPHPELVTVSFMPDATDIGGIPSNLVSTMNAKWSIATWQKEILKAAQSYAANANLNFSVIADDGAPFGSAGLTGTDNNMQGDANFGDVRIGGFNLDPDLGLAMLPPPINGDTTAGDFFLNTNATWNIGSSFDLFTVSAHEAGHSVGLDHSAVTTAVMYTFYNGVKSSLASDDIAGVQSIYGARPQDSFDASASNNTRLTATNISPYIGSNKQVTLTNPDVTTTADRDWYKITIPSGHSGTMTVQMQSSKLSLLAPKVSLYNSGGTFIKSATGGYNSTILFTRTISTGQVYYIKAEGADATVFGTGHYALQVNMGSAPLPPVNSPNTATPSTGLGGSGSPMGKEDHADHDGYEATQSVAEQIVSGAIVVTTEADRFQSFDNLVSTAESTFRSSDGFDSQTLVLDLSQDGYDAPFVAFVGMSAEPDIVDSSTDAISSVDELLDAGHLSDLLPGYGFLSGAAIV